MMELADAVLWADSPPGNSLPVCTCELYGNRRVPPRLTHHNRGSGLLVTKEETVCALAGDGL